MLSILIATIAFAAGAQAEAAIKLNYDASIDPAQVALMQKDVAILPSLKVEDKDGEVARLFQIPLSGAAYEAWLAERAHYILSADLDISKSIRPMGVASYPDTPVGTIEVIEEEPPARPANEKVYIVMSNIGAGIYAAGKTAKLALLGLNVPGLGKVKVSSPRMGVFQIGEGHFLPLLRRGGVMDNSTYANSIARLGTFIHEARHSDGNGASLGFNHAVCPASHDFAGYYACDRNLNGPYTIGAVFVKSVLNNCANCSEAEKEALRFDSVDSFSRVIRSTPPQQIANLAETKDTSCKKLRRLISTTINTCATASTDVPYSPGYVPTLNWDPKPEDAKVGLKVIFAPFK